MDLLNTFLVLEGLIRYGSFTFKISLASTPWITMLYYPTNNVIPCKSPAFIIGNDPIRNFAPSWLLAKATLGGGFMAMPGLEDDDTSVFSSTNGCTFFLFSSCEGLGISWTAGFSSLCSIRWFCMVPKHLRFLKVVHPNHITILNYVTTDKQQNISYHFYLVLYCTCLPSLP